MPHLINSLIAHYKLNDNAATAIVIDSSGNGHTGEYQLNNVAQNTDTGASVGKILGALDFVGGAGGELVEIPDHNDFSPGDGTPGSGKPFSISSWVYMHDAAAFMIASKGVFNVDGEWQFYISNRVIFRVYDESVDGCYIGRKSSDISAYINQWIHVVTTYGGGNTSASFKTYLNAVRNDNANQEANPGSFVAVENLNHDVWIGRYANAYANGLIDNVMFYNKELTLNDVKSLYNSGTGTENISIGIYLSRTGHSFSSRQEM